MNSKTALTVNTLAENRMEEDCGEGRGAQREIESIKKKNIKCDMSESLLNYYQTVGHSDYCPTKLNVIHNRLNKTYSSIVCRF